jgi:glyoxylase-like metal-dependent hydrolase (beta-lactamase superfamily II)
MILQRVEQADWLSNAYLAVDEPGGIGVLVDCNGVVEPLLERAEREGTRISHILLTHDHGDHVAGLDEVRKDLGATVVAHQKTADALDSDVDQIVGDGDVITAGGLKAETIFTPGHAAGHVAFLIDGTDCITGDVLFRGTVGGTMAPGATGIDDLRTSIMDRLLKLPGETRIHPGHRGPSTVGEEAESNPFVRIWNGAEPEGSDKCTVWEREATLVLWAPDYDGGNKAWVRFADTGEDAIVGGSQVER